MQVMANDAYVTLPVASVYYDINKSQKKLEFALPIYTHKFT